MIIFGGNGAGESGDLGVHIADTNNPHSVVHTQAGADVAGSSDAVQGNLNTHTADESNPHNITMEQVGAITYVDRGDPENYDFTKEDLTLDLIWHDLNLSNIVPVGTSLVHLRVKLATPSLAGLQFRKKGNTNLINAAVMKVQVANVYYYEDFLVACDSNRIIQYLASDVSWTTLDIIIRGWFEK